MRKLRIFGAVAVLVGLVGTVAVLSLLPNSVSAKPSGVDCVNNFGEIHFHGINVYGTDEIDDIDCSNSTKALKIYGLAGSDTILGGEKNDKIYGGDGEDTCTGGPGYDSIYCEVKIQ